MILLKTLASLLYVLVGGWGYFCFRSEYKESEEFSRPVFAALLLSMAGDVLLALPHRRGVLFIFGVVCFSIAHVLFSLAFCRISAVSWRDLVGTLAVFASLVFLMVWGDFSFHGILPLLIGYGAVISFMAVKALSLWRCRREWGRRVVLVMWGGVLFLLSDIVLLFWMFGRGMPREVQYLNLVLYYPAQGCMAGSLVLGGRKGI